MHNLTPDELLRRYSPLLAQVAEQQIGPRLRQRTSVDDILQTVFRTYFRRSQQGRFQIEHEGALWALLLKLTCNKIRKQAERHTAQRRDVAREVLIDPGELAWVANGEAGPHEVAALTDELEWLLAQLAPRDVEIVRGLLAEESEQTIAGRARCSRATVRRVRERIAFKLRQRATAEDDVLSDCLRQ
jgi:hypothetical protein